MINYQWRSQSIRLAGREVSSQNWSRIWLQIGWEELEKKEQ